MAQILLQFYNLSAKSAGAYVVGIMPNLSLVYASYRTSYNFPNFSPTRKLCHDNFFYIRKNNFLIIIIIIIIIITFGRSDWPLVRSSVNFGRIWRRMRLRGPAYWYYHYII